MLITLLLFRPLNTKLVELLEGLSLEDWARPTVAKEWTVKDIAAHLLDGSVRTISWARDQWEMKSPTISGYDDLVRYLNQINAEWVIAMRRVSPKTLIEWHRDTHEEFVRCLESLDSEAPARFAVSWAGQSESPNWFHIAREFTEKWHHQQQIRESVGRQGILTPEFYPPVLDTFLRALPHRYRDVDAPDGTTVDVVIKGDAGGTLRIQRTQKKWMIVPAASSQVHARIEIPETIAWKVFTKAIAANNARDLVKITGEERLALPVLSLVAVMA